ncbi:MAG: ATP-binding protein, partial [Anaerolineales bacterium]
LGLILLLLSGPQNIRARLMGAVWLLAGVVLACIGPGYANGAWFVVDVILITYAIGGYFSLAAHLYFPAASFSDRARLVILRCHLALFLVALAAYIGQRIFSSGSLPPEMFVSAIVLKYIFNLTWLANLVLLLISCFAVKDPETRRQANIVFWGTLLGVVPFLVFTELPNFLLGRNSIALPGSASALTLILIPGSYAYAIAQHRLLKLDRWINRALNLFTLATLIVFVSAGVMAVWSRSFLPALLYGGIACGLAAMLATLAVQKRLQVGVNRTLYSVHYDFSSVATRLAKRLAEITEPGEFAAALEVEFAKPMSIRKSDVLLAQDGFLELRKPDKLTPIAYDAVCRFLLKSGRPERAADVWEEVGKKAPGYWATFTWARVLAPVVYNDTLHGLLLLGDRLNGDYYSDQDMQNINTVGQMFALAIASLDMVESLRDLNQRLAQAEEEQRLDMARELHDDVLQDLFFAQVLARSNPDLAAHLGKLAERVRRLAEAQRTSMNQNIAMALGESVDGMKKLAGDKPALELRNLLPEPITLNSEKTMALYRIVQEALANVLKHADAENAAVTLKRDGDVLEVEIRDRGVGMEDPGHEPSGHHGLTGMRERAAMIGATLSIASAIDEGTTVSVRLKL